MRKLLIQLVIAAAVTGSCSAGVLDALGGRDFSFTPPAPSASREVSAPQGPELKGENAREFCYFAHPYNLASLDETALMKLPREFCVQKTALTRLPDGKMTLQVTSDLEGLTGGRVYYRYSGNTLDNVYGRVLFRESKDANGNKRSFQLEMEAKVHPNGNLLPGAAPDMIGWIKIYQGDSEPEAFHVRYVRKVPPPAPAAGACFARGADEYAAGAGLPERFCVTGTGLVRKDDGSLELSVAGDLRGQFGAAYFYSIYGNYVKSTVFSREDSGLSGYRGSIAISLPTFSNGDIDPSGQILVAASTGYNSDIYHLHWDDRAVKYTAVPSR